MDGSEGDDEQFVIIENDNELEEFTHGSFITHICKRMTTSKDFLRTPNATLTSIYLSTTDGTSPPAS